MAYGAAAQASPGRSQVIELTVNGKPRQLESAMTLLAFLERNGINPQTIAVEHNGAIVKRERYAETALQAGDRLEIVRMVGGGGSPCRAPLTGGRASEKGLEDYRALFPITRRRAYLNHAALGPLSTRSVEALGRHSLEQADLADDASEGRRSQVEATRRKVAALIGAEPGELAHVKNTPEALGIVAAGLRWRAGDRVVSSDQEFPANIYPWLNLAKLGVELELVKSRDGRVPIEEVLAAIDDRTRLVALSWVEFSTGFRNDLETIAAACHERGALFAVDGIQGVGALQIDFRAVPVDFLAFSSHKWLLGPLGVGWLYCRREVQDQVHVVMVGQGSVPPRASWLDYALELWPDARRFESGAPNSLGLAGVEAAVDLLAEVGMDRVEARIAQLTGHLAAGLEDRGYLLAAPRGSDDWSGIVSFSRPAQGSEALQARLAEAGISTSVREGRVRVSPHFYNTEEEVDAVLAALP